MKRFNIVIISVMLMLLSCEKDNKVKNIIEFEGISITDIYGSQIGAQDTTDWRFDDQWLYQENELFSNIKSFPLCEPNENLGIIAFPNPCKGYFYVHVEKDYNYISIYRLVDKDFNIIRSSDSVMDATFAINLKECLSVEIVDEMPVCIEEQPPSDTIYRLYYMIKNIKKGCIYKGHGDIKIGDYATVPYY